MLSEIQIIALRNDVAQRLFEVEGAPAPRDEGDVPEERAAAADRLRMAVDVLTHVLTG